MRRMLTVSAGVLGLVLTIKLCLHLYTVYDRQLNYHKTAEYHIFAEKLDLTAVDSGGQQITRIYKKDQYYELELKVTPVEAKVLVPLQEGPEKDKYLAPTNKIQSDSPAIKALAHKLIKPDSDVISAARAVADWTSDNISYDQELAMKISKGQSDTQSALDTLRRHQGTCSEYANVFIAVMRAAGVPTKFVSGHVFGGIYHSWAEVKAGQVWIPVDPQMDKVGLDNRYIKLFAGVDFPSLHIELTQIGIGVERLE